MQKTASVNYITHFMKFYNDFDIGSSPTAFGHPFIEINNAPLDRSALL